MLYLVVRGPQVNQRPVHDFLYHATWASLGQAVFPSDLSCVGKVSVIFGGKALLQTDMARRVQIKARPLPLIFALALNHHTNLSTGITQIRKATTAPSPIGGEA